tara:strand:- start:7765 stop:8724 length:960 start_codon:yes stop_codon:yes gene_type:complete
MKKSKQMNDLKHLFQLIRFKNLIIIISIQVLIKLCIINLFIENYSLDWIEYFLYITATITIVAAGYIINDIYDITTDLINKKNNVIINKYISEKKAFQYYFILNFIGILCNLILCLLINKLKLSCIFIYFIFALWIYSKKLKKSFLLGNIQVAFLVALSIVNIIIFDVSLNNINNDNEFYTYIILIYASFSFITTLIREINKDIEDIKGDLTIKASTIPIKFGVKKSALLNCYLIILTVIFIAFIQFLQLKEMFLSNYNWGVNYFSIAYCFYIQILLFKLLYKTYQAESKSDFSYTSILSKKIMVIGILSIPFFSFIYA